MHQTILECSFWQWEYSAMSEYNFGKCLSFPKFFICHIIKQASINFKDLIIQNMFSDHGGIKLEVNEIENIQLFEIKQCFSKLRHT